MTKLEGVQSDYRHQGCCGCAKGDRSCPAGQGPQHCLETGERQRVVHHLGVDHQVHTTREVHRGAAREAARNMADEIYRADVTN